MIEEMTVSDLGNQMKQVLANTFVMYMAAHKYHFNVEGRDFYQYHAMYKDIYDELWLSLDQIGEQIRSLDEYVPYNFGRLQELATIDDDHKIPVASVMLDKLLTMNDQVIASLNSALEQARVAHNGGLENFLGGRLEVHAKHGWMLRSTAKQNRE
jgi:starvation-inducible DNA-binding protein